MRASPGISSRAISSSICIPADQNPSGAETPGDPRRSNGRRGRPGAIPRLRTPPPLRGGEKGSPPPQQLPGRQPSAFVLARTPPRESATKAPETVAGATRPTFALVCRATRHPGEAGANTRRAEGSMTARFCMESECMCCGFALFTNCIYWGFEKFETLWRNEMFWWSSHGSERKILEFLHQKNNSKPRVKI